MTGFKPTFIRIHRSYLVNLAAVTTLETVSLFISDIQLPISRRYRDDVTKLTAMKLSENKLGSGGSDR